MVESLTELVRLVWEKMQLAGEAGSLLRIGEELQDAVRKGQGDQKFREAVSRGINSNGVKFYLADHPDEERLFNTGKQHLAYTHFLDWLGGLLSEEIGVLFNPHDSANRLYPTEQVLGQVLDLINDGKPLLDEFLKTLKQRMLLLKAGVGNICSLTSTT
jgi:hypothetical protein